MDNLVQGHPYSCSINVFGFDHMLIPASLDQNHDVNCFNFGTHISDHSQFSYLGNDDTKHGSLASSSSSPSSDEEINVSDAVLNCISQMLMEDDDLDIGSSGLQDSFALRAAEKSLYDVLVESYPLSSDFNGSVIRENSESPDYDFRSKSNFSGKTGFDPSSAFVDGYRFGTSVLQSSHNFKSDTQSNLISFGTPSDLYNGNGTMDALVDSFHILYHPSNSRGIPSRSRQGELCEKDDLENKKGALEEVLEAKKSGSTGKRSHHIPEDALGYLEQSQSNKQFSVYDEDSDDNPSLYDDVLLCPSLNPNLSNGVSSEGSLNQVVDQVPKNRQSRGPRGGKVRAKRQGSKKEVVDLMTLLSHCALAVASNDNTSAYELLKQIKQHSTPQGDSYERLAHYFASALEARLSGTGRAGDTSLLIKRLSGTETLKAFLAYAKSCPFKKISYFFANKSIWKLAEKATKLHIIDFGIIHGFQWPRLIQQLSERPGGPPILRITGVDFPQPGFRPAGRVDETGRRLAYYCEKFKVPFEYNGVAKKWDTIQLEDLKIHSDDILVVNCLYMLRYVSDETVDVDSPRDAVLKLIKRSNANVFIHGVVNGTYNSPFFATRFREVMLQSYAAFDMLDATLPREDQGRMIYEKEVLGGGAMSVVACEGTARVIRPETYKQWAARNTRAGLKHLQLDQDIMNDVRTKIKLGYHKDFVVDVDGKWMLQGWKGRILSAISTWKAVVDDT